MIQYIIGRYIFLFVANIIQHNKKFVKRKNEIFTKKFKTKFPYFSKNDFFLKFPYILYIGEKLQKV